MKDDSMRYALALAAMLFLPPAAMAEDAPLDGPTGVAIVASPEMGSGRCFETTPEKAFDCARQRCEAASGDQADQCTPVRWCLPALFGADVVVNDSQGFTYHRYVCDEPTQDALIASTTRICESALAEGANACDVASAWGVNGDDIVLGAPGDGKTGDRKTAQ